MSKALKNTQHEKPYQCKRKGTRSRFHSMHALTRHWLKPSWILLDPEHQWCLSTSIRHLSRVVERQKFIRIADCSELEWNVVSEYTVDDELGADSEGERRLEKCQW